MSEVHIHVNRRPGCLAQAGGCLLLLILIPVARSLYRGHEAGEADRLRAKEQEQKDAQRAELKRRIADWAREHAPELDRAIEELGAIHAARRKKIGELERTFRDLDRRPEEDADWVRWRREAQELEAGLSDLRARREEAFVLWEKFRLNEDPAERRRYEESLRAGREAAEAATGSLKALLER